ncbi:hypothetical protein RhiLY_12257 [Ceratobasidium sp. AG-Ba]|nr:hypothetical protein RhiLY_12257 [Ceratobasidium sp. AG-Ba]
MTTKSLKAGFITTSVDVKTISEEGAPITIMRVRGERKFVGSMNGTGMAEYLIWSNPDVKITEGPESGKAVSTFTGKLCIYHFKGSIDGSPEGEVILIASNRMCVSAPQAEWTIDEKTAIGGLKGLKGKGGYKQEVNADGANPTAVWLEYTLQ